MVFTLSDDEFRKITCSPCLYCGRKPSQIVSDKTASEHGDYVYNGVDRVDSDKGYISGNCVSCCKRCNGMKSRLSLTDFLKQICKIFEHFDRALLTVASP
jgi:hypothetical protein